MLILGIKNKDISIKIYEDYILLLSSEGLNICRFKCGIYKLNTFSNIYYMNKRKFNLFLSIIRNILMGNMYK